jgi:hypothetical protein
MSSSFVRYRERGFWSYDPYLEHFLTLLATSIVEPIGEDWLREAKGHWLRQSSGDFAAFISTKLDDLAISDARRETLLRLIETVVSRRESTPEVKATAALLTRLLEGRLNTDESSPRDYMVTGDLVYDWRA